MASYWGPWCVRVQMVGACFTILANTLKSELNCSMLVVSTWPPVISRKNSRGEALPDWVNPLAAPSLSTKREGEVLLWYDRQVIVLCHNQKGSGRSVDRGRPCPCEPVLPCPISRIRRISSWCNNYRLFCWGQNANSDLYVGCVADLCKVVFGWDPGKLNA